MNICIFTYFIYYLSMGEMTIHDLHRVDKPREKLARYGAARLTDVELLALLLGSGKKGLDVLTLSSKILTMFPRETLLDITVEQLCQVSGIGQAKASIIIAAIEFSKRLHIPKDHTIIKPYDVWVDLVDIREQTKEHFVVILLNARNQKITSEVVSVGIVDASLIHPREVFEPAIKHVASTVVLAHNHPSGNVEPSDADLLATNQLVTAGKLLGISVMDHVIVAKEKYFSFAEHKLL